MNVNYFEAKGVFIFKTDQYKTEQEFFDFLEANGIEFTGGYESITRDKIEEDVAILKDIITDIEIRNIVKSNAKHYSSVDGDTEENAAETMELNFGTDKWLRILQESLTGYRYSRFIQIYENKNWNIGDLAFGKIGNMLAKKIRDLA